MARTLQLFTEAPSQASHLDAYGARFELPDFRGCSFATFWVREADTLPPPIDAGLAGTCVSSEHGLRDFTSTTVDGWPWPSMPCPSQTARHATLRVYVQPNETLATDAHLGDIRTYELVFSRDAPPSPAASQSYHHRQVVFSCGPLGFALASPRALAAYAERVGTDDLIARFTSTDDAVELMARGEFLPVLGIHAWTYRLVVAGAPLEDEASAVLGDEVLSGRRFRVAADDGAVSIVDGSSLHHASRLRVLASMPWSGTRVVAVRGLTHGPHGEGLIPTYVFEPTSLEPYGAPLIDADLGHAFETREGVAGG